MVAEIAPIENSTNAGTPGGDEDTRVSSRWPAHAVADFSSDGAHFRSP
jgi:hypothetical protein